jgi:P-type conjugative transfer protein TrbJ
MKADKLVGKIAMTTLLMTIMMSAFSIPVEDLQLETLTEWGILPKEVETAANTALQVTNTATQIENQVLNLRTITGNFSDLDGNLSHQYSQLNEVMNTNQKISYTLSDISSQYKKLFPSSSDWSSKSSDQYESSFNSWSDQLHQASLDAMKSQSMINNVQNNNEQARSIMSHIQGDGYDGEVAQLQSINQMLSVIANQLGDLVTETATASRLSASAAAEVQSQQDAYRASLNNFLESPSISVTDGHRYMASDF